MLQQADQELILIINKEKNNFLENRIDDDTENHINELKFPEILETNSTAYTFRVVIVQNIIAIEKD